MIQITPHPPGRMSPLSATNSDLTILSRLEALFHSSSSQWNGTTSGDGHNNDDDRLNLPIFDVLPTVQKSLFGKSNLLLEAPPGAGKTTVLPLAILWWKLRGDTLDSITTTPTFNESMSRMIRTSSSIWMVQPRRVAVRSAASRMTQLLGEDEVGQTVGYQIRGESRGTKTTSINVVTPGILLQRLRMDPELTGINTIIMDEFHERGVDSDVVLALCRQTQQVWRKDLQIVVMSATLLGGITNTTLSTTPEGVVAPSSSPADKLMNVLGGPGSCQMVRSDGRQYPITVFHSTDLKWSQARPVPLRTLQKDRKELVNVMSDAILQGIMKAPSKGDVLAFLPGAAEIRRTVQQLSGMISRDSNIEVVPLYGALSKEDQDYALLSSASTSSDHRRRRRRVIVSSPIAEASLTLEGVTCVVDSGLRREPKCDIDTNMPRLVTTVCSQASAIQRAGRAGRIQEGMCLRIYTQSEFMDVMPQDANPEILSTDLCPTTLLLVDWGCSSLKEIREDIPFVDLPPMEALETSARLLADLGALTVRDSDERNLRNTDSHRRLSITELGQQVAAIPTHPRIAVVLQKARETKDPIALAAAVAVAFLLDDDSSATNTRGQTNLVERVTDLYKSLSSTDTRSSSSSSLSLSFMKTSFLRFAARLGEDMQAVAKGCIDGRISLSEVEAAVGPTLLPGFIDLIAERKSDASYGGSTYLLSLGRSARLERDDDTSHPPYAVVAETSTGDDSKVRIRAFAAISKDDLMEQSIEHEVVFTVPSRGHEVRARKVRMIGSLELDSTPMPMPSPEKVTSILKETISSLGGYYIALMQTLAPEKRTKVESLIQRVRLAVRVKRDDDEDLWPIVFSTSYDSSGDEYEREWEALVEPWLAVAGSLKNVDLLHILEQSFSPEQRWKLDKDFPVSILAPDGSQIPISYSTDPPSASGKLQQFFGTSESPRVGPAHSPISVSLSLLSPAGKVVAQTMDLVFFWSEIYPQVRAELRGRYAKHPWPDDPMNAVATRQTKKQMAQSASTEKSETATNSSNSSESKKKRNKRK